MAGILDSDFAKLMLSGSPYMKARYKKEIQDEKALRAEGLMSRLYGDTGEPSSTAYGGIMPVTETTANGVTTITGGEQEQGPAIQGELQGGSGLLGGEITQPQFDARMQAGLAGIYGAEGLMQDTSLLRQRGNQAMGRQIQQQQYDGRNMSAYQRAQLKYQEVTSGIKAVSKNFEDTIKGMTAYRGDVKPYQDALDRAESTNHMIKKAGGVNNLSGPDELAIMIDYARMTKPENLTAEDMDNIMSSFGISGSWVGLQRRLGAGGRLGNVRMTQIVNSINTMRETKENSLNKINETWGEVINNRALDVDFRRQPAQAPPQTGRPRGMPDDVVQIN